MKPKIVKDQKQLRNSGFLIIDKILLWKLLCIFIDQLATEHTWKLEYTDLHTPDVDI